MDSPNYRLSIQGLSSTISALERFAPDLKKQLDKEVKEQQNKNLELEKRNAKIAGDVDDLRQGTRAVEERARIEHGMVKENETLVQILQSDESAPKLSKVKPSKLSEDSKLAKSTPTQ